jgi:hypothetical protein
MRVLQSTMMTQNVTKRCFHAGGKDHTHEHENVDEDSHSDFKAKSKTNYDETQLNSQISKWI